MAIKIQNIRFGYEGSALLKDCSFNIGKGKIYSLLGGNGCGKTTLIKIIGGVLKAESGNIIIDDREIGKIKTKELARKIAYVPQEHISSFPYSVLEIVVMGRNPYLGMFSRPSVKDYNIAKEALNLVGICSLKDRNYMNLSGGEKQLVFIARAIAQEAKYILLDEPTANLDFKNQYKVLNIISKIVSERKIGVLISLHDPNLALTFSDYGIMIKDGSVLANGNMDDILTNQNLRLLYDAEVNVSYLDKGRKFISIVQEKEEYMMIV
ncbi:ABC transporter ATP-binding protein [Lutibacter sp. B2]|nr:ABC transporter ATP-binding protein [Lutibacter sp. B2]